MSAQDVNIWYGETIDLRFAQQGEIVLAGQELLSTRPVTEQELMRLEQYQQLAAEVYEAANDPRGQLIMDRLAVHIRDWRGDGLLAPRPPGTWHAEVGGRLVYVKHGNFEDIFPSGGDPASINHIGSVAYVLTPIVDLMLPRLDVGLCLEQEVFVEVGGTGDLLLARVEWLEDMAPAPVSDVETQLRRATLAFEGLSRTDYDALLAKTPTEVRLRTGCGSTQFNKEAFEATRAEAQARVQGDQEHSSKPRPVSLRLPLRPGTLERVRSSSHPEDVDARARLLEEAERALLQRPGSVIDKGADQAERPPSLVLPGGDIHDYVGYRTYYWPNPSTADGLPYVQRDGYPNHAAIRWGDAERLKTMVRSVDVLAMAYFLTGEERFAEHADATLSAWFVDTDTAMNPHMSHSEMRLGVDTGRPQGILQARHLAAAPQWLALLSGAEGLRPATTEGVRSWMRRYAKWLQESAFGRWESVRANNHGAWYEQQLIGVALAAGDRALAERQCSHVMNKRIPRTIELDGSILTPRYRVDGLFYLFFYAEALYSVAALCEGVGVNLWTHETEDGRGLHKLNAHLADLLEGRWPWLYGERRGRAQVNELHQELMRRADGAFEGDL